MTASDVSLRELLQGILNDSDDGLPLSRISPLDITTLTPNKFDGAGQARFQALLDHAQPIYVTDADGCLSAYSRAFAEIHNEVFAVEGSLNVLICELRANDAEIRQSNTVVIAGETHHFLSHHYPLRDNHGNLIGFGGIYEDISALAQSGRKGKLASGHHPVGIRLDLVDGQELQPDIRLAAHFGNSGRAAAGDTRSPPIQSRCLRYE
jgi:PAS domain-containing protein